MMRQAVFDKTKGSIVGTGMEYTVANDSGLAKRDVVDT